MLSEKEKAELMRNKDKADFKERLCHSLDIQPDIFPRQTFVELRGRNSLTVKGCGRVSKYTETEIRLLCADGELCVKGRRLCCTAYHKGAAVIDGYVCGVWFEGGQE